MPNSRRDKSSALSLNHLSVDNSLYVLYGAVYKLNPGNFQRYNE